jgi:hypothetical protein
MVTKEQFVEWKTHPVTIEVYEEIERAKQILVTHLSEGATIGYEAQVTHGQTNKVIGQIEGLNQLLNLTYEDEEQPEE